jgi:hypothetical protein
VSSTTTRIQEEGLQKPKIGDVSPRIESAVYLYFYYALLRLCSTWSLNLLCWFCSNTLFYLFSICFPFHLFYLKFFITLLYCQFSFLYISILKNIKKIFPFIIRFEETPFASNDLFEKERIFLIFQEEYHTEEECEIPTRGMSYVSLF